MGEFFRGWRRKVGCITLLMASVFAAGWVRSCTRIDLMFLRGGFIVISANGKFAFSQKIRLKSQMATGGTSELTFNSSSFLSRLKCFSSDPDSMKIIQTDHALIPYLPIVIPLTLMSAFLLLTKPCQSNQKKTGEPTASEGAAS